MTDATAPTTTAQKLFDIIRSSLCFGLVVIVVFGDSTDDLHGDGLDGIDDGDPEFVLFVFLCHKDCSFHSG